jgi:MFS family permease
MAKNGMVMTAAAVIAPGAGGFLAGYFGYAGAFAFFGAIMLLASLLALRRLPMDQPAPPARADKGEQRAAPVRIGTLLLRNENLYLAFLSGFAVLYAQGTLVYEIPLLIQRQQLPPTVTGILFGVKAAGSMLLLSQLWLNRISPHTRIYLGLFLLGLFMYAVAAGFPGSLYVTMFMVGACFGLLFPAITTMLAQNAPKSMYGGLFSLFSAVLSLGAIISPLVAGFAGNLHHSFFIAFFVVTGSCLISYLQAGVLGRAGSKI